MSGTGKSRDRKQISVAYGQGRGGRGVTASGCGVFVRGDADVLELGGGDGHTIL